MKRPNKHRGPLRLLTRRYNAAENFCPKCLAMPGEPCKRKSGMVRQSVHRERMKARDSD
jgi:hypothetical protein